MRLKIEINTREHFHVHPLHARHFTVDTRWFSGSAEIPLYSMTKMLGTKVRALYQRRKGRDLFDLWHSHTCGILDPDAVIAVFVRYMDQEGQAPNRNTFVENLRAKLNSPAFLSDLPPLLRPEINYDPREAAALVENSLLMQLS